MEKIIIIGDSIGLPHGYAASNRTIHLAKALKMSGCAVEILLIKPSEDFSEVKNIAVDKIIDGISIKYTTGCTYHSKTWIGRRLQSLKGLIHAIKAIYKSYKKSNKPTLLIYSRNIEVIVIFGILAKTLGLRCVLELCEWPITQGYKNSFSKLKKIMFCNYALFFVDSALVISNFIQKKVDSFNDHNLRKVKTIYVPILCDSKEVLKSTVKKNHDYQYILFCSHLSYVNLVMQNLLIFKVVSMKHPDLKFLIVGSSNSNDIKKIKNKINFLGLKDKVELPGYVSRAELIDLYQRASILLLPLENNPVNNARFPSKLSEYLLSGRPVVATPVGEINNFLNNNKNAYVAKSDSYDDISECILNVLSLEDAILSQVGANGRTTAILHFDYRNYEKKLNQFLLNKYDPPQVLSSLS